MVLIMKSIVILSEKERNFVSLILIDQQHFIELKELFRFLELSSLHRNQFLCMDRKKDQSYKFGELTKF